MSDTDKRGGAEINTVRAGDKIYVMNGHDPISYVNLANIHRKWWQIWKRKVRTYPKVRYAIYYKFKKTHYTLTDKNYHGCTQDPADTVERCADRSRD